MPKSNYRSQRDRRKTQTAGTPSPVPAAYGWFLESATASPYEVRFQALLYDPINQRQMEIAVWESLPDINGIGITAEDIDGNVEIFAEATAQNIITISADYFNGLTRINIPAFVPILSAPRGIQCFGGFGKVPYPATCTIDPLEVFLRVSVGGALSYYTLTGSAQAGVFTSIDGWILEWIEETQRWRLTDPIAAFAFGAFDIRCNPSATYTVPSVWISTVQLEPFTP